MTTRFKKNLVLATAIISPLFISAPAMANTTSPLAGHQAIGLLTDSVKHSLTAYDSLERGNLSAAERKLDQALLAMKHAVATDPSLGLYEKDAASLKEDIKAIRLRLHSTDIFSSRQDLAAVLTDAGVVLES